MPLEAWYNINTSIFYKENAEYVDILTTVGIIGYTLKGIY